MDILGEVLLALSKSWPFWIAVVAIVFVLVLRAPLGDLIRKTRKITREGLDAAGQEQLAVQEQQAAAIADPRRAADELLAGLDNPHALGLEQTIRENLAARGLTDATPETHRVLIRYTAAALVAADFERIDNLIYGSQLQMLVALNGSVGATPDMLRPYYEAGIGAESQAIYPFDSYMGFLADAGLVLIDEGRFQITVKGRTFLQWLMHQGRSLTRAL